MPLDTRLLLAIDDDATDRKRIIRWLGHQYAICEAATGRVGIDMARRLRPGCVLLDYGLPDASGLDILQELIRSDFSVILLTGQGDEDIAVRALKAGAVDYLVKDNATREEVNGAVSLGMARSAARRKFEKPRHDLSGFEGLAEELLRPGLASVSMACSEAVRVRPDLERLLGPALETLVQLDEHVSGLRAFATVDRLCGPQEPVDLIEVGGEVKARLSDTQDVPRLPVEIRDLPIVHGSREALFRAMFELMRCALRHALPEGEGVRVHGALSGSVWQINVEDDGDPPSEREMSREVFLPFSRGTGRDLGLALAAQIVRRHQGDIWIETREPRGLRVTFTLPFKSAT